MAPHYSAWCYIQRGELLGKRMSPFISGGALEEAIISTDLSEQAQPSDALHHH